MLAHKTYGTEKEKNTIIAEMLGKGFTQVSTGGYFIGEGHLLFDDGNPEPEPARDLADEIDEIKAKIADYDELKAKVEALGL